MEFESVNGLRLRYWFSAGVVVNTKSWIYRGDWYSETWIRTDDGREWRSDGGLLGVAVNRGHRLAFAWCAANGAATGELVAVKNCTSGELRAVSGAIATRYGRKAYGRWGMLLSLLLTFIVWQAGYVTYFPAVVTSHWALSLSLLVLIAGILGYVLGDQADADPEREVDQKIQVALTGMEYAWRELQRRGTPSSRTGSRATRDRNRNVVHPARQHSTTSAYVAPMQTSHLIEF